MQYRCVFIYVCYIDFTKTEIYIYAYVHNVSIASVILREVVTKLHSDKWPQIQMVMCCDVGSESELLPFLP